MFGENCCLGFWSLIYSFSLAILHAPFKFPSSTSLFMLCTRSKFALIDTDLSLILQGAVHIQQSTLGTWQSCMKYNILSHVLHTKLQYLSLQTEGKNTAMKWKSSNPTLNETKIQKITFDLKIQN